MESDYLINPKTNSMFKIFGTTQQLAIAARFWVDEANVHNEICTYVGFRVRVEMNPEYPKALSFPHVLSVQFPEMDFTKTEKDYASWTGGWLIKFPLSKKERVRKLILSQDLVGKMYDTWVSNLPGVVWKMDRDTFIADAWKSLSLILEDEPVIPIPANVIKFITPLTIPKSDSDDAVSI